MVLHREGWQRLVPDALDGSVVEIHMSDLQTIWYGLRYHGEIVVLARDLHLARREVFHGMVAAVVPELEPRRLRAAREREQLMSQADAHNWKWVSG